MRVSKVSLFRSLSPKGEGGGALTALCVDVVRRVHHTHMVITEWWRGALATLWARTVTLSRRGRDRVTTRVVAESKAASDDTHGRIRTRFDAPHHVVIPSIHPLDNLRGVPGANHLAKRRSQKIDTFGTA